MGLKETLHQATISAFKALGNLNVAMTFKSVTGVTRDLTAGTSVPVSTDHTMRYGVFVKWEDDETDKDASLMTTSKFIFPLSTLTITPKVSDFMVETVSGKTWEIMKILHEPSDSVGKLAIRKSK